MTESTLQRVQRIARELSARCEACHRPNVGPGWYCSDCDRRRWAAITAAEQRRPADSHAKGQTRQSTRKTKRTRT